MKELLGMVAILVFVGCIILGVKLEEVSEKNRELQRVLNSALQFSEEIKDCLLDYANENASDEIIIYEGEKL